MIYDTLTVPELKKHLANYGLRTSGKKQELLDRLNEYDAAQQLKRHEFNVFVKVNFSNYTIKLDNGMDTKFMELKKLIFDKSGYEVNKQRLYYISGMGNIKNPDIILENGIKGMLVDDDKTLADYNICRESSFKMIPRLC